MGCASSKTIEVNQATGTKVNVPSAKPLPTNGTAAVEAAKQGKCVIL